jgi:hemerythrin
MDDALQRRVAAAEGLALSSLKSLIKWGDDFRINRSEIDSQHERIFKLAAEASELSRKHTDRIRLRAVFDEFGHTLTEHFHFEETELAEMAYPRLDEHRAEHQAMLAEFDFIRQRLASKGEGWAFQEEALVVLNFMLGVTVGHILHSDIDFAHQIPAVHPAGNI